MTVTITIPDDLVSPRTGCISQGPKFVGWAQINRSRWISVWCREIEIARVGFRFDAGRSKLRPLDFDPMPGDRNRALTISRRLHLLEFPVKKEPIPTFFPDPDSQSFATVPECLENGVQVTAGRPLARSAWRVPVPSSRGFAH